MTKDEFIKELIDHGTPPECVESHWNLIEAVTAIVQHEGPAMALRAIESLRIGVVISVQETLERQRVLDQSKGNH